MNVIIQTVCLDGLNSEEIRKPCVHIVVTMLAAGFKFNICFKTLRTHCIHNVGGWENINICFSKPCVLIVFTMLATGKIVIFVSLNNKP